MNAPEIIIIAAIAEANSVIGHLGQLPWHIPEDLQRFRQLTWGHAVIMGRKTWELGLKQCSLPGRHLFIVSRSPASVYISDDTDNTIAVNSLSKALTAAACDHSKIFIAGGTSIYAQMLQDANTLELTFVAGIFPGDAHFPAYQALLVHQFALTQQIKRSGYRFETYHRKPIKP